MNRKKKFFAVLFITISVINVLLFSGCMSDSAGGTVYNTPEASNPAAAADNSSKNKRNGVLTSYYLDVGQGDCEFIELPNGECMLIDAADTGYADTILNFIQTLGYKKLNYLVATHPHADHIGSMADVIRALAPEHIYMPRTDCTTETYEGVLRAIAEKGLKIKTAKAGVSILSEDGLSVEILSPSIAYDDLNNSSAVILITYGDTRFLYMGDAESEAEQDITADVKCDVIKVGHHGSDSSSSKAFIKRTAPKYAIISVGRDNRYGHPSNSVIKAWKREGAQVFRTDKQGVIAACSDGKSVSVAPQSAEKRAENAESETYSWVLNTSSHKIHKPSCKYANSISDSNRTYSQKSIEQLQAEGYTCCGACNPE